MRIHPIAIVLWKWNYRKSIYVWFVHCCILYIVFKFKSISRKGPAKNRRNGGRLHETKCQSEKSPGWFMVALNGRKTLMNIFFSIKMRRIFPHRLMHSSLSLSLSASLSSRIVAHWSILSVLLSPQRPSFPFWRLNVFLKWPKKSARI